MNNLINLLIKPAYAQNFIGNIGSGLPSGIPKDVGQTTAYISSLIRFIVIIAGIFTLWQFLSGGLGMITGGGDKAKIADAQHKITMSILGLVVVTGSFIIIGLVSQLLFGSFTAILIPELQTPN